MTKPSQRKENPCGFTPSAPCTRELGLSVDLSTFGDTRGQSKACPCPGVEAGEAAAASKQLPRFPTSREFNFWEALTSPAYQALKERSANPSQRVNEFRPRSEITEQGSGRAAWIQGPFP